MASLEIQTYDSITFHVCYNVYVGVYTSIDLYVNNGFPVICSAEPLADNIFLFIVVISGFSIFLNRSFEMRVTVAPVSINILSFTPFTLALMKTPASKAGVFTPIVPVVARGLSMLSTII